MPRPSTARARLERLRTQIDAVDASIVALLARRARLAKRAMSARAEVTGAFRVRDRGREAKLAARWRALGRRAGLAPDAVLRALGAVLAVSRAKGR